MSRLSIVLTFAILAVRAATALQQSGSHIDHVPIAVRDLPAAVAQFRSLGFTIKPGRPHQNGIGNASIKFGDGSYIELITTHDGSDALARQYQEFLKTQEGAAYVFVRDDESHSFSRRVQLAGGRRQDAGPFAFTELPSSWLAPHLQLIEYLSPAQEPPGTYQHANGARRVVAVWTFVEHDDDPIVRELGAGASGVPAYAFEQRSARPVRFAQGTCLMLTRRGAHDPPRSLAAAILIEVDSLIQLKEAARLDGAISHGPAVWLPPSAMHGVWLGFVEKSKWDGCMCAPAK